MKFTIEARRRMSESHIGLFVGEKCGKYIRIKNSELTKEKAYILGVICSDGSLCMSRRRGGEMYPRLVRLFVKDKEFAQKFADCIKITYGIEREVCKEGRYWRVTAPQAVGIDVLKYGKIEDFRELTCIVPEAIKNGIEKVKIEFLRGFWDSQGGISNTKIRAFTGSPAMVEGIIELMSGIGINSYSRRERERKWKIIARGFKEFVKIGFVAKRKQERLEHRFKNLIRDRWSDTERKEARRLRSIGKTIIEIAMILNRPIGGVRWILEPSGKGGCVG